MFNNIIYLIIVLLIFNVSFPEAHVEESGGYALLMHVLGWCAFALYCRLAFRVLMRRMASARGEAKGPARYQGLVMRLSILAVFLFALDVHFFHLRYWLQFLPGAKTFSVIPGVLAVGVFFAYLVTVWYFAYPAYAYAYGSVGGRRSFILGNLRMNLPILFPWLGLTLLYDLIALTPWGEPGRFLNSTEGQMAFFTGFLLVLMTIMPRLVQTWWGCRPFPRTETVRELEAFLRDHGLRYRALLRWPLFEGRMLTAGIMGIVPRYRYILVTDGLMELLSVEELKAVLAHEMGHARYRHLLFYLLFFLGYIVLSFGLFDVFFYVFASQPVFVEALESGGTEAGNLFYLSLAIPILITLLVYFRFVMGFFMRNFERQADLFAMVTMGHPGPVIRSLERIALASGNIRDLPSWHHFSIRQRVDCLMRAASDRGAVKRHNRFVAVSFLVYLACMGGLGWLLNFSDVKQNIAYRFMSKALSRQIEKKPDNALLYRNLATIYHHLGEHAQAKAAYEKALAIQPAQPSVLNNLAWLLVTAPDSSLRDPVRGLHLARLAVSMERAPAFLDTLAEAYYVNEDPRRAVELIEEALSKAQDRREYYASQRKKFMDGLEGEP